MRGLAYGICGVFAVLTAATVLLAFRTYDGPVEEDYFRKSSQYFREREKGAAGGIHEGAVAAFAGDRKVVLDIDPKPVRTMRELVFTVEIEGYPGTGPLRLDLSMAGMSMGPNAVALSPDGPGRYRGRGIIVRCPSGRRSWIAAVTVPGKGQARFAFDVAD